LSRKVRKSRTQGRNLRTTRTKAGSRVGRRREPRIELEKVKARARELEKKLAARDSELAEALGQQAATSEVLRVISSSPGELKPVFQAMLANATRLCQASYGAMWLCEGDGVRLAALHGALPGAYLEQWRSGTLYRPSPENTMAHAAKILNA
jgi:predicted component of type VI protein secretion system